MDRRRRAWVEHRQGSRVFCVRIIMPVGGGPRGGALDGAAARGGGGARCGRWRSAQQPLFRWLARHGGPLCWRARHGGPLCWSHLYLFDVSRAPPCPGPALVSCHAPPALPPPSRPPFPRSCPREFHCRPIHHRKARTVRSMPSTCAFMTMSVTCAYGSSSPAHGSRSRHLCTYITLALGRAIACASL